LFRPASLFAVALLKIVDTSGQLATLAVTDTLTAALLSEEWCLFACAGRHGSNAEFLNRRF